MDYLEIEQSAARLRVYLRSASRPELKLLVGLSFFSVYANGTMTSLEANIREFVPPLVESARQCRCEEFLPEDAKLLGFLVLLIESSIRGIIPAEDIQTLRALHEKIISGFPDNKGTKGGN